MTITPLAASATWLGAAFAAAAGASLWLFYFVAKALGASLTVAGYWWWFCYPTMFIACSILGAVLPAKAWRNGFVMMAANYTVALAFIPGVGSMLPLELLFATLLAVPCSLASRFASKRAP